VKLQSISLQYEAVESTIWQAAWPLREFGRTLPRPVRLALLRMAKLVWWTGTMQLPRRFFAVSLKPRRWNPVYEFAT
jgi:hypothetical protein